MGGPAKTSTSDSLKWFRLILALAVLLSHSAEMVDGNRAREPLTRLFHTISAGDLAVDGFFVLSGFLVSASWMSDPRLSAFMVKRFLRIFPAYFVAFVLSITVIGAIGAASAGTYLSQIDVASTVKNLLLLLFPQNPPTFPGQPYPVVNASLWTIHYEAICYLLTAALGVTGILKCNRLMIGIWALSLANFVVFRATVPSGVTGAILGNEIIMLTRFFPLYLSGAVLFTSGAWRRRSPLLLGLAAAILLIGLTYTDMAEAAVATAGAYLLLSVGLARRRMLRIDRFPDLSYGVYLYGWPMGKLMTMWFPRADFGFIFVGTALCSLVAGAISWFAVEAPALSFKPVRAES